MKNINDPIIKKWTDNYNFNFDNQEFTKKRSRPLMFLVNNKFYYNIPVVLVAAGPSLDKNISILKNYQKNTIILSVDVALYKLLENDIIPDFVINIDPSDMFVRFWNDLDTSNLTLICPTSAHPRSIAAWKGNIFFFNQTDSLESLKGRALKKLVKATNGYGNVYNRYFIGATMLQISSIFNPRPAMLIGYDFAYTDDKAYCDGFLDRKIYDGTLNPGTPEHADRLKFLKEQEINKEIELKDINNKQIFTTKKLVFYRNNFLRLIHHELKMQHIVNCSEGGILEGIPKMTLDKALEKFCSIEIQKKDIFKSIKRKRRNKR